MTMPKILLVEDNEMNRDMLSRRLERNGYEVVIAVDGAAGRRRWPAQRSPDLILMDMSLPVIDGWEATRRIKADPATSQYSGHRADRPRDGRGPGEGHGGRLRRFRHQAGRTSAPARKDRYAASAQPIVIRIAYGFFVKTSAISCGAMRLHHAADFAFALSGLRSDTMATATQPRPRAAAPTRRPSRWLARLVWAVLIVLLVVLLLPYLLVPLYRVVNPVSTLMLWRWATGARVERTFVPIDRMAPSAAGHGHRVRGRPLLQPSRRRLAGDPRPARRCRRHQRGARRLDHHPADRQEPVPVAGAQLRAQGAGGSARALDRPRPAQAARARNLSQHRRMGPERPVRRRGRQPLRLQQVGARAQRARGGAARRGPAESAAAQRQAAGTGGAPARRASTRRAAPPRRRSPPAPNLGSRSSAERLREPRGAGLTARSSISPASIDT